MKKRGFLGLNRGGPLSFFVVARVGVYIENGLPMYEFMVLRLKNTLPRYAVNCVGRNLRFVWNCAVEVG